MSNESSTASLARSVISESSEASTTPAAPANVSRDYVASHMPQVATDEVNSLIGDGDDNYTRRVAAVEFARRDTRPWVATQQMQVRRAHDDGGNPTSRAAREMIDMATAFEGREIDPRDRRGLAIQRFVTENPDAQLPIGATLAERGSPEWYAAVDAAIDAVIKRGRESR